jgi:lipooligosaccharide transport system ATP-binding protein
MSELAIKVTNVSKSYQSIKAVNALSFEVEAASCLSLLGPNGAGKTTMMKMLYGMVRRDKPDSSLINVLGYDPIYQPLEIKYLSGIVPQEDNLDIELSVIQNLLIYAKFYGLFKKKALSRIMELLSFMELLEKKDIKIRELSGGMKRRLIIARALLNSPRLLILDEPTTGLDPQVRHLIWDKLHLLKKEGVTILLTTHYMEEAFQLSDRVIIMYKGEKILEGPPVNLIREHIEPFVLEIYNLEKKLVLPQSTQVRMEKTASRGVLNCRGREIGERQGQKYKTGVYFFKK